VKSEEFATALINPYFRYKKAAQSSRTKRAKEVSGFQVFRFSGFKVSGFKVLRF